MAEPTVVVDPAYIPPLNPDEDKHTQNKKRASSNDLANVSAKRPRTKKDTLEQPKNVKPTRTPRKPRNTTSTKLKQASLGSSMPIWSVVSGTEPSPPQDKPLKHKLLDIRPRLWTSTREELMSTFVEISGSKCVNNISWVSTDMPILILDDEFVLLEKVKGKHNRLYMDVTFTRQCLYKEVCTPKVDDGPANAPNDTTQKPKSQQEVSDQSVPSQVPSQMSVGSSIPHAIHVPEERDSAQPRSPPPEVSSQKPARRPEPATYYGAPNKLDTPTSLPGKDYPKVLVHSEKSTAIALPQSLNRVGGHKPMGYSKNNVLGSLRFKKNKATESNSVTTPDTPSPSFPSSNPFPNPYIPDPSSTSHPSNNPPLNPPKLSGPSPVNPGHNEHNPYQPQIHGPLQPSSTGSAEPQGLGPTPPPGIPGMSQCDEGWAGWRRKKAAAQSGLELRNHQDQRYVGPTFPRHPNDFLPSNITRSNHDGLPRKKYDRPMVIPNTALNRPGSKPGTSLAQTRDISLCSCSKIRFNPGCVTCDRVEPTKPISLEIKTEFVQPTLTPEALLGTANASTLPQDTAQHDSSKIHPGPVDTTKPIPSSRKRKGKEKEKPQEPDTSGSSEQPPTKKTCTRQNISLPRDPVAESIAENRREILIPSTSKVKLEDFTQDLSVSQVLVEELSTTTVDGGGVAEPSVVSNSNGIHPQKPVKRKRGRKAAVEALPAPGNDPQIPKPEPGEPPYTMEDVSLKIDINEFPEPSISSATTVTFQTNSRSKSRSHAKLAAKSTGPLQKGANDVPLPIPDEMQALVNAYINCAPVGIFAASGHLRQFWNLNLVQHDEFGYVFMGFYRVSRVWEDLETSGAVTGEEVEAILNERLIKDRVRWKFRLRWEPGGEDWRTSARDDLASPWWDPKRKVEGFWEAPQPEMEDSDDESTSTYRLARREAPNFSIRRCSFNQLFFSVLPLHLLAPANADIPDSALPRGWHCQDCGKLNFRYFLRHRKCESTFCKSRCKDLPEAGGYAMELDRLRDPQDGLPLSLPLNEMSNCGNVDAKVQAWNDWMKTLYYGFGMGIIDNPVMVHHIFTCNSRHLQEEPSDLLDLIQVHVPLRRMTGDINPYFTHSVDDGDQADSSWTSAHECLQRAKELMHLRARKYGHKTDAEVNISRLDIRAWVTAGSKRASDLLCAKQRCIIVMCLGCEVIMSISPKSAIASNDNQTHVSDLDKLIPMDGFDPGEDQLQIRSEEGVKMETELVAEGTEKSIISSRLPLARIGTTSMAQKQDKVVLSVSLIHGDIMVLAGDDFEYSIKRTGTSILLIGS